MYEELIEDVDEAIERAGRWFLENQSPEGYWVGELESNVTITSEYLMLLKFLGIDMPERERKIRNYLLETQRPEGYWNIFYGGDGDINATVEAYFALKLLGESKDSPHMKKARDFILEAGGIPSSRVFTKIWLSLFGQYRWEGVPIIPPEIILLPTWFPVNIYEFASWARGTIVPLTVVRVKKPVKRIPDECSVWELYRDPRDERNWKLPPPRRFFSLNHLFLRLETLLRMHEKLPLKPLRGHAIKEIERWIIRHQEADGSWGGIQPPWVYSIIALHLLGYPLNHPVIKKALDCFDLFGIDEGESWHHQSCVSPVWDTALAVIALRDAGLPPEHPALVRAGRWLLKEQITDIKGDWAVKNKKAEPGGWAFEFENDLYPDVDDTAIVLMALLGLDIPDKEKAIEKGLRWMLSMQSKNGGFGAFDKDNDKAFLEEIPFADFGKLLDPPSVDVTSHIVEVLGRMGYGEDFAPLRRAVEYIRREQEDDGSWFGRWGINYIYGTWSALLALRAVGEDVNSPRIRKAVDWLKSHQNPDGGWGEDPRSYEDLSWKGRGESTPSQTAWAIMGLIAGGEGKSEEVVKGVRFLIERQREDGSWDEPQFTGTGFPRDFYLNYHLYRNYFPLMALGRFRKVVKGEEG